MDEYFIWKMQTEQAQYFGLLLAVFVAVFAVFIAWAIRKAKDLRRKYWRLLIRQVDPNTKTQVFHVEYGTVPELFKWHAQAQRTYRGAWEAIGRWDFYKLESQANWLDRLRSSHTP